MNQSLLQPTAGSTCGDRAGLAWFCEAFWRIETDLSLLTRSVDGVHYWPLLRLEALNKLLEGVRLYAPLRGANAGLAAKLSRHFMDAAADAPRLLLERFGKLDGIYLPNRVGGGRDHFDFPLHGVGLDRDPGIERLLILYRTSAHNRSFPATRHVARRLTSFVDAGAVIGHATAGRFLGPMIEEHRRINARFLSELGMDFPFDARHMARTVAIFSAQRRLMAGLLTRAPAPRLFVEVGYCMAPWIAAAKDAGMEVCEIQHGLITRYHLGYSYPGRPVVPYAPDRLLLFGPYWEKAAELPGNTRASVIGSSYLDNYKAAGITKTARLAVVISQGVIGPALFDAVATIAGRAPEWQFCFRAHPGESTAAYAEMLSQRSEQPANMTVSPPSEDFSTLLRRAEVQIGVFSTGLFEGMGFGTRTILLPLPGIEYMDEVLDRGEAVLARDASEIPALLETAPTCRDPAKYYSAPVPSIAAALSRA